MKPGLASIPGQSLLVLWEIKKFVFDVWGDAVNIAARVESKGEVGRINISQTTYDLVKHKIICRHRGKIPIKNQEPLDMYFVERAGS